MLEWTWTPVAFAPFWGGQPIQASQACVCVSFRCVALRCAAGLDFTGDKPGKLSQAWYVPKPSTTDRGVSLAGMKSGEDGS